MILEILEQFPQGAPIEAIKEASGLPVTLRTLQRRLDQLKEQGDVTTSGKTRATLYHRVTASLQDPGETMNIIPLSKAGQQIRNAVMQPQALRRPAGYNREFLIGYRPNTDSYLTPEDKARLAHLGKTIVFDQPAGTYAKEILQRLLIDLSWNSSRLEGNTYSLLDTQQLILMGKTSDDKTAAEAQMILNHKDAIEFLVQGADEIGFNRYTITNLHAMLSGNLLPDPAASGRLRTIAIGITSSVFMPLVMPQMIEEMFNAILEKVAAIENPFEQAFFMMVHIPYLQPFDDVNKRVSRLAANIPLNKHNLAPLAFVDVPKDLYVQGMLGVYEQNRTELLKDVFMWAYERSASRYAAVRQSLGEPDLFRLKYREDIRALVALIITQGKRPEEASRLIREKAFSLPANEQHQFIETVDTELLSLHDGNFARYRIRPSEFMQWKKQWG